MLNLEIDWKKVTVVFMKEEVSAEIRPLSTKAFNLLLPYVSDSDAFTEKENESDEEKQKRFLKASSRMAELQWLGKDIFPTHLRNIEGITVNNKPLTFEQLANEVSLAPLASAFLTHMMSITQIDETSEKN